MSPHQPLDVRLAVPAAAAWATAAALIPSSASRAGRIAVVASALTAAVLLAWLARWRGPGGPGVAAASLAAAAMLGVATGAATTAVHLAALERGPVPAVAGQRAEAVLDARLVRDPIAVTSRRGRRLVVADATVTSLRSALSGGRSETTTAPVVVFAAQPSWLGLLPGQRVRLHARLAPRRPGDDVAAVAFARGPPTLLGRPPPWQRAAGRVRAALRVTVAHLPADERGLLPGLVIGDVSAMPPDLTAAFRATGLSHLTAVSGENVAILFGTVTALVRRAGVRRRARVVVAAGALAAFVVLVRPTPSVLRAAVMGGLVLVGMLRGRRAAPVPLLAAAVLGLVVVDPFLARSAGFALSVLATSAIVIVAPRWTDRLAVHMPRPLAAAVAVPAAAQLACTPVIVAVFGQLTPWAVPANLLAAPAVAPATVAGMATAMTAVVVRGPAEALAWAAAVPTRWLAAVARGLAHLPGGATRWPRGAPVGFAAAAVVVGLVALVHGRWRPTPRGMLTAWRR